MHRGSSTMCRRTLLRRGGARDRGRAVRRSSLPWTAAVHVDAAVRVPVELAQLEPIVLTQRRCWTDRTRLAQVAAE
jgi:hypothetical protein